MAFKFYRDDVTRESFFRALFGCFNTENLRITQFLTNMNSLLMGVTPINKSSFAFFIILETEISSGARPALPMGVVPEAIVESFLSIGSSKIYPCILCIAACSAQ
jgi:hypothetical protein